MSCRYLPLAVFGAGLAAAAAAPVAAQGAATAVVPVAANVTVQDEIERRTVNLSTDSAVALESEVPFAQLSIANPDIADISTISNTGIYLLGKAPGRTTLMLMTEAGKVTSIVDVRVSPDISEFEARLAEILPDEDIRAMTANDGIVLSGRVSSSAQMDQALALAGHYAPGRVSNLMTVEPAAGSGPDVDGLRASLDDLLPDAGVAVEAVGSAVILTGEVASRAILDRAVALAEQFAPGGITSFLEVRAGEVETVDAAMVERYVSEILPREAIEVHALGGALVLTGTASSEEARARAMEIAALVAGSAPLSDMISVDRERACIVRTRKGGELVVTDIPCNP